MSIQHKAAKRDQSPKAVWERLFSVWEHCVRLALTISIVLIGVGRIEADFTTSSLSAWSVSRTAFFFWLIGRLWFFWYAHKIWNVPRSELLPLLLFIGAVGLSLMPRLRDLSDFRYLSFAVAHCVMVLDLFRDYKGRRFLILALGVAPALVLLRGVYANPLILKFNLANRLEYPLDHANTAGHLLAMSLPLAVALLLSSQGRQRIAAAVAAVAQLFALLLTYSRGAWLGFTGALACWVAGLGARKELLLLLGLTVALLSTIEPLQRRVLGSFYSGRDQAITDRLARMRDTLRVGLANPVLGVGYGRGRLKAAIRANPASETKTTEPIWHGHNLYLELFAGTGVLGLGAYLWLVAKAFGRTWQAIGRSSANVRILTLGLMASAVAMLLCGLGDVTFHHHETRLFCFTLLALMLLDSTEEHESALASGEFPTV